MLELRSDKASTLLESKTTTVGLVYSDGVVLASDRRASRGMLVSSKVARKTIRISDDVYATISGLVADAQFLTQLAAAVAGYELYENKHRLSPREVAVYLSHRLFYARPFLYITHLIIAGFSEDGSPQLLNVDLLGMVSEEKYLSTGSGSLLAFSILEKGYTPELTEEQAIKLAVDAVKAAISRDTGTGDGIDVTVITRKGIRTLRFTVKGELVEERES
ncbi:MAG: proteasome subunit beta [Thermoproteota archaeon]|nr:MAG: proteasome subunit beta [Candidatus Korarchaeota archaeon]RLG55999.1 MAG: proteasome subunit beta [Candidatus Korarchaeota archaeon]